MANKEVLKDLLEDEIKDLYSAEKQLTKAIPKMAKGLNDPALQAAFNGHLKETEAQAQRLEQIAEILENQGPRQEVRRHGRLHRGRRGGVE